MIKKSKTQRLYELAMNPIKEAHPMIQEYLEGHLRWEIFEVEKYDFKYFPSLDMYTLTGWISVSVGFLSLVLFLPGVFQVFISMGKCLK